MWKRFDRWQNFPQLKRERGREREKNLMKGKLIFFSFARGKLAKWRFVNVVDLHINRSALSRQWPMEENCTYVYIDTDRSGPRFNQAWIEWERLHWSIIHTSAMRLSKSRFHISMNCEFKSVPFHFIPLIRGKVVFVAPGGDTPVCCGKRL